MDNLNQAYVTNIHAGHVAKVAMWSVGNGHGQAEVVELIDVKHAVSRCPVRGRSKPGFLRTNR